MPLIADAMLDFATIKTPAEHGDILVAPAADRIAAAAEMNRLRLRALSQPILDTTVAQLRSRHQFELVGRDDRPLIVTGHAPDFIHAGVWAKHVVATRLARAMKGDALDLIVDCDTPKETVLRIPVVRDDRVSVESLRYAPPRAGMSYEQIGALTAGEIEAFAGGVRRLLGGRYERSQMPLFFDGLRACGDAVDWVEQSVHARRAIETPLGIVINDVRVSRLPLSPIFAHWLLNAERFSSCYNRALALYREQWGVRSANRPIPDLVCTHGRFELPIWACRGAQSRQRFFAEPYRGGIRLWAFDTLIGSVDASALEVCDSAIEVLHDLDGWQFRPRALALTLWARVFLADLFIHGIGGAKYDRITDTLMEDYYGIDPPHIACVSATLLADLPRARVADTDVRRARSAVRDILHNPQRHLTEDAQTAPLLEQRRLAGERAKHLKDSHSRDRSSRRELFLKIRELNAGVVHLRPSPLREAREALADLSRAAVSDRVSASREFFFGLHDRDRLEVLVNALPAVADLAL